MGLSLLASSLLVALAAAQKPGDGVDNHPRLKTWKCTNEGGCKAQNTYLVADSLSHVVYQKDDPSLGCGNWGSGPNSTVCPDIETCQENCIMEPITDYTANGIYTDGSKLTLKHLTEDGSVLSPRVYLLAEDKSQYEMLHLTGQEFTFDVDVSQLPCGMNGALYLSEMEAKGGESEINTGGASWGTGYCDAQCFTTPFINGIANIDAKGSCCNELDIWEANARATHLAPHTCNQTGLYLCEGEECGWDGVCDEWGCGLNPYHTGHEDYYGHGLTVDTDKKFTVITQFHANDEGILTEIHRMYMQDGELILNAVADVEGLPEVNYMDDEYCDATGGATRYLDLGATAGMGEAMTRGMVLAMSIWWDEGGNMVWLDSGSAGPCLDGEGAPSNIRLVEDDPTVVFENIKWGEIGSTFNACPSGKGKGKGKGGDK